MFKKALIIICTFIVVISLVCMPVSAVTSYNFSVCNPTFSGFGSYNSSLECQIFNDYTTPYGDGVYMFLNFNSLPSNYATTMTFTFYLDISSLSGKSGNLTFYYDRTSFSESEYTLVARNASNKKYTPTVDTYMNYECYKFSITDTFDGNYLRLIITQSFTNSSDVPGRFTWLFGFSFVEKTAAEIEEEKANSVGNDSVDSVTGSVPDKASGFLDGIKSLAQACSYAGTDCNWKLPSIKLPAISGVMDETVLSEEMSIPFSDWFEKIPSNVISLVRAFGDIGLIVFCAKELYGLIKYAMTLKGGDE